MEDSLTIRTHHESLIEWKVVNYFSPCTPCFAFHATSKKWKKRSERKRANDCWTEKKRNFFCADLFISLFFSDRISYTLWKPSSPVTRIFFMIFQSIWPKKKTFLISASRRTFFDFTIRSIKSNYESNPNWFNFYGTWSKYLGGALHTTQNFLHWGLENFRKIGLRHLESIDTFNWRYSK